MSDIVAGDVAYTMINQRKLSDSRNLNRVKLVFGDSALTYPVNGIPITKGKLGCPTVIESMIIVDQGASGYKFQYDQSAEKLIIMQSASHLHDILVLGGLTSDEPMFVNASVKLAKNAATNRTLAGGATNGGIQSAAAAALSEASAVAIAAQTIEVEVVGW